MLDHVFVSVSDLYRSIEFYERALAPLGIRHVVDYDGANGRAVHVGFVAKSEPEVDAFYAAALSAGATDNGKPGVRLYYDPRYYAANVLDPDGYSIEVVYKSWQHPQS